MHFIALLLIAVALIGNLNSYKNVFFQSKKKRAEAEQKFNEALEKLEDNPIGKKFTNGMVATTFNVSLFFSFLFYLVTSVVVASPFIYALAVIILILDALAIQESINLFKARKFLPSKWNRLAIPVKTVYIIGFIALFFI